MLQLFKRDNIALNRVYKCKMAEDFFILVFPFSVSKPKSNSAFEEQTRGLVVHRTLIKPYEGISSISSNFDKTIHKSSDYKNNLIACMLLTDMPLNNKKIGDVVYIPMSDFSHGCTEEVIGYSSHDNIPITSSELEYSLKSKVN